MRRLCLRQIGDAWFVTIHGKQSCRRVAANTLCGSVAGLVNFSVVANVANVANIRFVAFVLDASGRAINVRGVAPNSNQTFQINP